MINNYELNVDNLIVNLKDTRLIILLLTTSYGQCKIQLMLEICPRGNNKSFYCYILVFMINVYIHAIIVLTGNINTCVFCKHKRVPSKPLVKLAC